MRQAVIFNVSELELIAFNEVLETSISTVRKSLDNTKTFVKWEGDTPQCVQLLQTKQGPYTMSELLEILEGGDWSIKPAYLYTT
jgi:hypothetical protein